MLQKLAVTGLGMISPVGHSAQQTCASLRAGITRFAEVERIIDRNGEPVIVAQVKGFGTFDEPLERLRRMAVASCNEALASFSQDYIAQRPITLSILLQEAERPGIALDTDGLLESMIADTGLPPTVSVKVFPDGNAGGMKALLDAEGRIGDNNDTIELLWGIDSLVNLQTLTYLDVAGRLKSVSQSRGVIPGEASVCLALEHAETAHARGKKTYCTIEAIGIAVEPVPLYSDAPCLGEGLTTAIYMAMDGAKWQKDAVAHVFADLNGEVYRAHEWMLALCRTLSDPQVIHPADCLGDVGAASSVLLLGMAALAFDRGYIRGKRVLVVCSSDTGLRGCACISGVTP